MSFERRGALSATPGCRGYERAGRLASARLGCAVVRAGGAARALGRRADCRAAVGASGGALGYRLGWLRRRAGAASVRVAVAAWRGSPWLEGAASACATLSFVEAWFDVLTNRRSPGGL